MSNISFEIPRLRGRGNILSEDVDKTLDEYSIESNLREPEALAV
ncbi:MAG: hypothetical protein ACJ70S_04315 [Nitrososphaera sp.]